MAPVRFIVKEERACKNLAGKLRSLATFGSRAEGCWKVAPGWPVSALTTYASLSLSCTPGSLTFSHTLIQELPRRAFKADAGVTRHLQ